MNENVLQIQLDLEVYEQSEEIELGVYEQSEEIELEVEEGGSAGVVPDDKIAEEVEKYLEEHKDELKGEKGDPGESGITTPINGFFTLSVDADGNLWAHSAEEGTTPDFEYDGETGNLYVIQEVS